MFFKSESQQGDLNGFLDRGSELQGELRFEQNFRVDGKITGSVVSDGILVIGEHGEIEGEIKVRRLDVAGLVRGRIEVSEQLQITASGRVYADIAVPSLRIEDGATFEGRCSMNRHEASRERSTSQGTPGSRSLPPSAVEQPSAPAGSQDATTGPPRVRSLSARVDAGTG